MIDFTIQAKKKLPLTLLLILWADLFSSAYTQGIVQPKNKLEQVWSVFTHSSLSRSDLIGNWTYKGTACAFETENLLKKAGGVVVASQVERTFDEYSKKIGIGEGKCNFIFNEDSTYSARLGFVRLSGKYSFDEETKIISMNYLRGLGNIQVKVHKPGSGLKLMFDSGGFLKMMKTASMFSKNNSVEVLAAMADLYDGMLLGFDLEMKKQP